jgi:hypothetical protein
MFGWGNGAGYGAGPNVGGGAGGWIPYAESAGVQDGFNQAAVMNGINNLTNTVSNGFANAEVSRCNA